MASRRFFACKYPEEIHELAVLHPYALIVFAGLTAYCYDRGYPAPTLTSIGRTEEENAKDGAESMAHPELRAFDVRSTDYTLAQIEDIKEYMNREFAQYAAVSSSNGKKLLCVYHEVRKLVKGKWVSGGWHFHFQIHRRWALPTFTGMNP
jgi:hypothetical protein